MIAITLHEVNTIAQEFDEKLKGYRFTKVFTIFGILNRMLYLAAIKEKIISHPNPKTGLRAYNKKNIGRLAQPITVISCVTGTETYLKEHWARAAHSVNPIRETRELLSETFKLFTLEDRDWSVAENRGRAPNPCSEFDSVRSLILAERCEQKLLVRFKLEEIQLDWSQEIGSGNYPTVRDESKSMPEHKAYTLVALYNMMFDGIARWGRQDEPSGSNPLPEVVENIHNNFKELQAEKAFDRLQDEQPDRPPEEILATESFDFVAPEIIVSNGLSILVDRLIARIPLASVIRRSMQVPPVPRVEVKKEASVAVPVWAMERNDVAIAWWDEQLSKTGLWLSELAPSWVLDAILPF